MTIHFENDANSKQDIQQVKDQIFEAIMNGKDFKFTSTDSDGTKWETSVDMFIEEAGS